MKIVIEKSLRYFEFWGGAKDWTDLMYPEELDEVEEYLEELFETNLPFDYSKSTDCGVWETAINDLFWFEFETISSYLWNIDDQEEAWKFLIRRKEAENETKS